MEKDKAPKSSSVGRIVINAVRKLQGNNGVSLPAVKKFLRDAKNMDTGAASDAIKMCIKKAIDSGMLIKTGGSYKVKETKRKGSRSKRRAKSSGKGRKRTTSKRGRQSRRKKSAGKKGTGKGKAGGKVDVSRRRRRKTTAADENE